MDLPSLSAVETPSLAQPDHHKKQDGLAISGAPRIASKKRKAPRRREFADLAYRPSASPRSDSKNVKSTSKRQHSCHTVTPRRAKTNRTKRAVINRVPFDANLQQSPFSSSLSGQTDQAYTSLVKTESEESVSIKEEDDYTTSLLHPGYRDNTHGQEQDIYPTIEGEDPAVEEAEHSQEANTDKGNDPAIPVHGAAKRKFRFRSYNEGQTAELDEEADSLAQAGWSEADISLFRALALLSLKPFLPSAFEPNFHMLPKVMFCAPEDDDAASIRASFRDPSCTDPERDLSRCLMILLENASRIRACPPNRQPEKYVVHFAKPYINMVRDEAGLACIPLNFVVHGDWKSTQELQAGMLTKIRATHAALAEHLVQHGRTAALADTIPIYGIICRGVVWSVVSFVPQGDPAFPPDSLDRWMHLLCAYDWKEKGQDAWNVFAFALAVNHARDELLKAVDAGILTLAQKQNT